MFHPVCRLSSVAALVALFSPSTLCEIESEDDPPPPSSPSSKSSKSITKQKKPKKKRRKNRLKNLNIIEDYFRK